MLIAILLCLCAALICSGLRYFNPPANPPNRDLGWLAFAFFVLAFLIEYAAKFGKG